MPNRLFGIQVLLALILPILITFIALSMFYDSGAVRDSRTSTSNTSSFEQLHQDAVRIGGSETPLPAAKPKGIGNLEVGIVLALVMGLAAMLGHYLKTSLVWLAVLVVSMAASLLGAGIVGLRLTYFFLPNLVLAILLTLIVRYVFFNPAMLRIRLIVTSALSALSLALYYRVLHLITGTPFPASDWQAKGVNGLIVFVFITFGLSVADLVIVNMEIKKLRAERAQKDLQEDEDAN